MNMVMQIKDPDFHLTISILVERIFLVIFKEEVLEVVRVFHKDLMVE
jgi:hypothetical protein